MGDICCTSLESSSFLNWKINLRNTGKKCCALRILPGIASCKISYFKIGS